MENQAIITTLLQAEDQARKLVSNAEQETAHRLQEVTTGLNRTMSAKLEERARALEEQLAVIRQKAVESHDAELESFRNRLKKSTPDSVGFKKKLDQLLGVK